MIILVLVMFTVRVAVAGRAHLVFVLMLRMADRIAGAFLVGFLEHVLGAALWGFPISQMMSRVHTITPAYLCGVLEFALELVFSASGARST